MKLIRMPKPRLMAVLLALIIVTGGIPFVAGTHVNDMLSPWRQVPDEPTGNTLLDAALKTASAALDGVADDERIPRRDEPQVPATFFHDIFDPDDRIGGWGDWRPNDVNAFPGLGGWTEEQRWHLDPSAAGREVQVPWVTPAGNRDVQTHSYDTDQGYRFGDENGYPMPDLPQSGNYAYTFLVSPLISLQSLPAQLPDERADVPGSGGVDQAVNADGNGTIDLTQQAAGARSMDGHLDHQNRIILYMDHKYHFALDAMSVIDRAGVFLLDEAGNLISRDWTTSANNLGFLPPLRGPSTTDNDGLNGVFSGAQLNFTEEAFDLTPFAGQDVRIGFEVGTGGLRGISDIGYFGDASRFQAGSDFYGWAISNVRIEGPAHMHNVRLDRVVYPVEREPDGGFGARPGQEPLAALLLNRGRVTEDVRMEMLVDGEPCSEFVLEGLRPGEARVVKHFVHDDPDAMADGVGCLDVQGGGRYDVAFHANLLGDDVVEDQYAQDNVLEFTVHGRGPDIRMSGPLRATPAVIGPGEPATVTLPIVNRGLVDEEIELQVRVDRRHPHAEGFSETDVHLNGSLVRIEPGVKVSPVITASTQRDIAWEVRLMEAGLYRVSVSGVDSLGDEAFPESSVVVGVFMTPEYAYDTDFLGPAFDDGKVLSGEWGGGSFLDAPPPAPYERVWELVPHQALEPTTEAFAGSNYALRGVFNPRDWQDSEEASVLVNQLEVEILHYVAMPGSEDLSVNLFYYPFDAPIGSPAVGGVDSNKRILSLAGSNDQKTEYYHGRWIRETHLVALPLVVGQAGNIINPVVGSVPVGDLATLGLEFRGLGKCVTGGWQALDCPTWRVAEAKVSGVPTENPDDRIRILHWSGDGAQSRGSWSSSASRGVRTDPQEFWPNCPSDEQNARAQEEDQQLRCPIWRIRDAAELPAVASSWSNSDGFWTTSAQQDGHYLYSEEGTGAVDMLVSPAFLVPDSPNAAVNFGHRFQLHPGDTGMVMVRFFDAEDDPDALMPFLPVEVNPAPFPLHARYSFSNEDCTDYYGAQHPNAAGGCLAGLLDRFSVNEELALTNLVVQDHRNPSVLRSGTSRIPVDLTSCVGGVPTLVGAPKPLDAEPCAVQFAFRLKVPPLSQGAMAARDENREELLNQPGGAEGWFLDSFRINAREDIPAFDLELLDVEVKTDYDWETMRFGPGTEARAALRVQNNGIFTADQAIVHVTIQNSTVEDPDDAHDDNTWHYEVSTGPEFLLDQGQSTRVNMSFPLPDADGEYRIMFGVELRGDLIPDEEIPLQDVESSNNCRFLLLDGTQRTDLLKSCDVASAGTVRVQSNPQIGLDLAVTPEAGRAGSAFPREVNLRVENSGNMVVRDSVLTVVITHAAPGAEPPRVHRWIVPESPAPGLARSWTSMELKDPDNTDRAKAATSRILLEEPGIYFVTAFLASGAGGDAWEVVDQVRLDAFDTIYSDTFEARGVDMDFPAMVDGAEMVPRSANWSLVRGPGIDAEGQPATDVRMWRFGDAETGNYPDGVDASLELPPVDLSSARKAILSISHNYDLERGYDGARVEACLGPTDACRSGAAAWQALEPRNRALADGRGYPGTVGAQNPLNADNDPRLESAAPAFTGRSTDRNPLSDGWVIDEFDLAQLPGFTTPVAMQRFNQAGFAGPHVEDDVPPTWDGRVSFHGDWAMPGRSCGRGSLDGCWSRENVNRLNPPPLDPERADQGYWWTGSVGPMIVEHPLGGSLSGRWQQPGTEMSITFSVDVDSLVPGDSLRVTYSYWKDEAGHLSAMRGTEEVTRITAGTAGWNQGTIDIPRNALDEDGKVTIRFRYETIMCKDPFGTCWYHTWHDSFPGWPDQPNRGAALDGVRLEVVSSQGQVRQDKSFDLLRGTGVGNGVSVGQAYFARYVWGKAIEYPLDVDGSNGLCTRETKNNFADTGSDFCELLPDGTWRVNFGWNVVESVTPTKEAWGIDATQVTHRGEVQPIWRFGSEFDPQDSPGKYSYPVNAHERLITPRIDLRPVAGESVMLSFWERFEIMDGGERRILVQPIEPTADGGERFGEWDEVRGWGASAPRTSRTGGEDCTRDSPGWCRVEADLSRYRGKEIRVAFEVKTSRLTQEVEDGQPFGWAWFVDDVAVEADSLTGGPVNIRLRAATDASINEGHWKVENVQLVGLTYDSNVAILPNEAIKDLHRTANEVIEFTGQVRNLGPFPEGNLYLDLSARAVTEEGEDVALPAVVFLRSENGSVVAEGLEGPIGPIHLGGGGDTDLSGEMTDRIPYEIRVTLPNEQDGHVYEFSLQILDENGNIWHDDNPGDHIRDFDVRLRSSVGLEPSLFSVDPPTLTEPQETANFTLGLQNIGDARATGTVRVTANRLDGAQGETLNIHEIVLDGEDLPPGRSTQFRWEWDPIQEGLSPGFYRITAEFDFAGIVVPAQYTHVLVGSLPLYFSENFNTNPFIASSSGSRWSLGTSESDPCSPPDRPVNCWRLSDPDSPHHLHGNHSLFVGDETGASLPEAQTQATTPGVDLSFLGQDTADGENAILTGTSPFSPFLSVKFRPMFVGGQIVRVQADREDDSGGFVGLGALGVVGGNVDEGRWDVASFPVSTWVGADDVSFRFDASWQDHPDGRGFAMDLVTLSSFNVDVDPPRHDVELRPGSNKTFYFHVENTGAAKDVYRARIAQDPHNPLLAPPVTTQVLTPRIELAPGQSDLVAVRVDIPFERFADVFSGADIRVEVISTRDPNRVATGTIRVDDFIVDDLADLVTEIRRPGGETGPVVEGDQATFVVTVTNDGRRASRETDLVVFACRSGSLEECMEKKAATEIGTKVLPALLPSGTMTEGQRDHIQTTTFSWVPPLGSRGAYRIVAVADPRQVVAQFDRFTSVDEIDLTVAPIERPDLQVVDLRVTDPAGEPVTRAFTGDVLHIEATVRNDGDAPAPNTRIRVANQFALRDERIGELNPGASHTMKAQWLAQPGNWVVVAEASTSVVEIQNDNNAARWSLAVRKGALQANWDPGILHIEPASASDAVLRLENRRDEDVHVELTIQKSGLGVQGVPSVVSLARGMASEIPVRVTASPFAEPGRHDIRIDVVAVATRNLLSTAVMEVHVAADRHVSVVAGPIVTPPGTVTARLLFKNHGAAPEAVHVNVDPPEAWQATVLTPTFRLEPAGVREVEVVLEIPPGTAPGRYPLWMRSQEGSVEKTIHVDVTRQAAWRTEVLGVEARHGEVALLVTNVGNIAGLPPFSVLSESDVSFVVTPVPAALEPGETRAFRLSVPAAEGEQVDLLLPGQDGPVPLEGRASPPQVEAVRLDVLTPTGLVSGSPVDFRFGIRSSDADAHPSIPVRLWVDGGLTQEDFVDLLPGDAQDVSFRWMASGAGPHVVTATAGYGEQQIARTTVVEVTADHEAWIPGPGFLVLLAALGIAMAVARRRFKP